jgi:hypothetical protein
MKRSILTAVIALAALPALASAQPVSASVTINATVQSSVTISSVGAASLTFPTALTPGLAASIAAAGAAASGAYQSQIVTNTPVSVAPASASVTMSDGGTGSFSVTLLCAESATADNATPTAIAGCATYVTPVGTRYYFLGASIAAGATTSVPAGAYTGSATLNYTWSTF